MSDRPNVLFIFNDQHRADCIGADPHSPKDDDGDPIVHTPNLNHFYEDGALFTRSYSPAPTCIPARRCLWTGQTPAASGSTEWTTEPWQFEHTLPATLGDAGYQTCLVGKSHSQPDRNHFGFDRMELHTGLSNWIATDKTDDYTRWLREQTDGVRDEFGHGLSVNTNDARPWHLPERLHPTQWTTHEAVSFLENRDRTRPFFLTVSYDRPHNPWDPPQPYWDMYIDRDLPDPVVGDWVDDVYGDIRPQFAPKDGESQPNPWCIDLPATRIHRCRAGYYGLITQIDHQLRRLTKLLEVQGELENTIVVMSADHGEMLGDHHLWYKNYGYEASARVPLLVKLPDAYGFEPKRMIDRPVGLEDIMPTLLELAGLDIPDTVEGRSLVRLLDDPETDDWREYYHGEHGAAYHPRYATQYVAGQRMKFIWNPITGDELLFDLEEDPSETTDLSDDPAYADAASEWREVLIDHLAGRPEGFTDGER